MRAAQFRDGGTVFSCRVAGVAVDRRRVLLHRSPHEDFWALPGGRIHVGETSAQALVREMAEEVGVTVDPGRLLWVIENFFHGWPLDETPASPDVVAHHEIGLYLEMRLPDELTHIESFTGVELAGTPEEFALEFCWFEQANLGGVDLRPSPLRDLLGRPLPATPSHIVVGG